MHLGLDVRQGLDFDFLHRSSDEVILRIMNVLDMSLGKYSICSSNRGRVVNEGQKCPGQFGQSSRPEDESRTVSGHMNGFTF